MMMTSRDRLAAALLVCALVAGCGGAEARKAKYMERAQQYVTEQNYTKARVELRNALQIDPKDAKAHYLGGLAAEKLNNPREAVGYYAKAIELDPRQMEARAALGRLYLFGGLPDKAMDLAEPGLVEQPKNAQLLTVRGAARAQLGDLEGAFTDTQGALEIAPGDEYTIALLASLHRQKREDDKAIAVIRAGIEQAPKSTDLQVILAELELGQQRPAAAQAALERVIELAPNDIAQRYRLARFYVAQQQPDKAERVLRDTVTALPSNLEAKLALIDIITARGGVAKATEELQRFLAKDPTNDPLRLAAGSYYQTHNQVEEAKRTYQKLIEDAKASPTGLTARNRLAAIALGANDTASAEALVGEVLKENPRDNDALILRGNIALAKNDTGRAITDLRTVLRDQPGSVPVMRALARAHLKNNEVGLAEEALRDAAQANPKDAETRLDLALLLVQTNKIDQGKPMLEQLLKEAPGSVRAGEALFRLQLAQRDFQAAKATANGIAEATPTAPLGFYLAGVAAEAAKDTTGAARSYERALEVQPRAIEPLTALVRLDVAAKKTDAALQRVNAVVAAQPDNIAARNLQGELLVNTQQLDAAVKVFEALVAKNPKWWVPYRGLALAQLAAKRNDAAVAAYQRGIGAVPNPAPLGVDLAALYERLGKPDDAIRLYEDLVERDAKSAVLANNLAMLLVTYRTDRPSLERAQSLTARFADASDASYVNTRGWIKFKLGDYQASLPLLQQAVEKSPKSPLMRYHLGMAQLRTGDRNAAKENLEVAVAGAPFLGVDEARAALQEIKRAG